MRCTGVRESVHCTTVLHADGHLTAACVARGCASHGCVVLHNSGCCTGAGVARGCASQGGVCCTSVLARGELLHEAVCALREGSHCTGAGVAQIVCCTRVCHTREAAVQQQALQRVLMQQVCCTSITTARQRACRCMLHEACVAQEQLLQRLCVAQWQLLLHEGVHRVSAAAAQKQAARIARGGVLHEGRLCTRPRAPRGGCVRCTRALLARERCTRRCEPLPPCFSPTTQRPPRPPRERPRGAAMGHRSR